MGLAIFLALSSVSITITAERIHLNLQNYPLLMLLLIAISIILMSLYIQLDKRKISILSQEIRESALDKKELYKESLTQLTARQEEIYQLIVSGKSNKEIIAQLFIEQSTLKTHINQIYKKLSVKSRRELKTQALDR